MAQQHGDYEKYIRGDDGNRPQKIADILMQMYENGDKGIKELKYTIKRISEELLESLRKQKLEAENLMFAKM